MALRAVTDPETLAQLNARSRLRPVTDPAILAQLNGERVTPQASRRGLGDEIKRQAGLAGRYLIEGVTALPGLGADALKGLGNVAFAIDDKLAAALGTRSTPGYRFQTSTSEDVSNALTSAGLPQPESREEEVVGNMSRSLAGAGSGIGLGQTIARAPQAWAPGLGQSLAAHPALQAASAGAGSLAADAAQEMGAGRVGQTTAALAGSVAPGIAVTGVPMATRGIFRGGEAGRQRLAENIDTFSAAGTTPTVGQGTESRFMRAAESMLSRSPGGSAPLASKADSLADDLAANIETKAATVARKTSSEQTGRQIERSIRGDGGFIDRFKAQQAALFDELDNFLPINSRVDVSKTKAALAKLNEDIAGAPATSQFFRHARIRDIQHAFNDDLSNPRAFLARTDVPESTKDVVRAAMDKASSGVRHPASPSRTAGISGQLQRIGLDSDEAKELLGQISDNRLPYEAVKKLRTLVGNEMAESGLMSDVPRSKWRALYAALSEDMKSAAEQSGPEARAAWSRANNYTAAGMRRIEAVESVLDRNGGPEAIFRAATANTKEGATTLRAVMQSLDDEGRRMVTATTLRRLGLAKPGTQGELGDRFSTESFLTNWNSLSAEAKRTLFDRHGATFREDMDTIAKVAANLRSGSQIFRNPSGTASGVAQTTTAATFVLSMLTGQFGTAAAVGSTVGGANLLGRLMTNTNFVRWLADSTEYPVAVAPTLINSLAVESEMTGDEDLADAAELLKQGYADQGNQNKRRQQGQ